MAINSNPPVLISGDMDESHKATFINQNFQHLADSLNPYILSDGTNNRLLIGRDSAGNYVVKVSKVGYDAFDAAGDDLIFNSAQNVFKIVYSSPVIPVPSSATTSSTVTIAHGLSYVPQAIGYLAYPSITTSIYPLPFTQVNPATGAVQVLGTITTDSTNVYLTILVPGGTVGSLNTFKYYLLQEAAN